MTKKEKRKHSLARKIMILLIIYLISIMWFSYLQKQKSDELVKMKEEYAMVLVDIIDQIEKEYTEGNMTAETRKKSIDTIIVKITESEHLNKNELESAIQEIRK